MSSKTVLHSRAFEALAVGHGGNRRALQIDQLLFSSGLRSVDVTPLKSLGRVKRVLKYAVDLPHSYIQEGFPSISSVNKWSRSAVYKAHLGDLTTKCNSKVLIWEDTSNTSPVMGCPSDIAIIALPHNIETLVQQVPLYNMEFVHRVLPPLARELTALQRAHRVFVISRYDQWILAAFGIKSLYLPYYPPASIADNLLRVRERRCNQKCGEGFFLILGSACNPPTLQGMVELIRLVAQQNLSSIARFLIVGYGTSRLSQYVHLPDSIRLIGEVSNRQLDDLLARCNGVVAYQAFGSGALTKLTELLVGGVPVIANSMAARSLEEYSDIHIFDDHSDLALLLSSIKGFEIAELPARDFQAEERFIASVLDAF